eukprot:11003263-Heterocapsa_arctica.AAC.1
MSPNAEGQVALHRVVIASIIEKQLKQEEATKIKGKQRQEPRRDVQCTALCSLGWLGRNRHKRPDNS